ncbi:MAG: tetratricopeptide repeat protein [Anaerolineae bacterium]|nr:MAG: tetratricopeptide repeat protein [Anaerolineae bacterium]
MPPAPRSSLPWGIVTVKCALTRLAGACRLHGRPAEAQTFVAQALALLGAHDPALSHTYLTRGLLAYDAGRFAEAEEDQRRGIALAMQARDPAAAWGLVNLGVALRQQKREDETLLAYRLAEQLFVEIDDVANLAAVRMNIGNVYLMRDQFQEALHWYNLAEPTFRQTEDRYRLSDIYLNRGIAQRSLGHLAVARADFERSLVYHRALNRVVGVAAIADAVGVTDMLEGDYASARTLHRGAALLTSIGAQDGPRGSWCGRTWRNWRTTEVVTTALAQVVATSVALGTTEVVTTVLAWVVATLVARGRLKSSLRCLRG